MRGYSHAAKTTATAAPAPAAITANSWKRSFFFELRLLHRHRERKRQQQMHYKLDNAECGNGSDRHRRFSNTRQSKRHSVFWLDILFDATTIWLSPRRRWGAAETVSHPGFNDPKTDRQSTLLTSHCGTLLSPLVSRRPGPKLAYLADSVLSFSVKRAAETYSQSYLCDDCVPGCCCCQCRETKCWEGKSEWLPD